MPTTKQNPLIDKSKRIINIPAILTTDSDDICMACFKSRHDHNAEEKQDCSGKLVKLGIIRFCGLCGLTKPSEGHHDRCGKCGEKYTFSNE